MSTTGENKKEQELGLIVDRALAKFTPLVEWKGNFDKARADSRNVAKLVILEAIRASEADSVSQTPPAESASVIPQSPVSDLESEWTVTEVPNFPGTAWIDFGNGKLAGSLNEQSAIQIVTAHNASLRQLREQKEKAEQRSAKCFK